MTSRQRADLSDYQDSLSWQCTVEKLFNASQPKPPIKGKIDYLADYSALSSRGVMSSEVREALLKLGGDERFNQAVESLFKDGQRESKVPAELPKGYQIPESLRGFVSYDAATHELGIRGPMSVAVRDELAKDSFPLVRPLSAEEQNKVLFELESRGQSFDARQSRTVHTMLGNTWVVDKLRLALDEAGKAVPVEKTPCELAEEQKAAPTAGAAPPAPPGGAKPAAPDLKLNARQRAELDHFVTDRAMTPAQLVEKLKAAGPFNDRQAVTVEDFFSRVPTVGDQRLELCVRLLREGPVSREQREYLVSDYREQEHWRQTVGRLFVAAHVTKYPWSGQYNTETSAFGWLYEFAFKPLQATMFALLAFYVASAAFRAFRAKNVEAALLLGTAFIILLGQTFAGYWLTSWIPEDSYFSIFRITNLIELVAVFLTAGGRAIMIGIALGVAATSLKMLLGIDRSYLGTGED
jgi:hypothetical protein